MARHKGSRLHRATPHFLTRSALRDDFYIASDLSDRVFEPVSRALTVPDVDPFDVFQKSYAVRSPSSLGEDRRTYHPAGPKYRPAESPRRHLVAVKPVQLFTAKPVMAFDAPRHVAICVRRKVRDEVLHALGKVGRGGSRKRRRNQNSKVRCT